MTGSGKTSAAIKYMRQHDEHYIYITPYVSEYKRIIEQCPERNFQTPAEEPSKLANTLPLLRQHCNIASTHALFASYTPEIVALIKAGGYTMIMDEAFQVIDTMEATSQDVKDLLRRNMIAIEPDTYIVRWLDDAYDGTSFQDLMLRAKSGTLLYYHDTFLFWMFPIEVFNAFENVIVMTYMFSAQNQRYYFEMNNVEYDYIGIRKLGPLDYEFCHVEDETPYILDLQNKIHIFDNAKLNSIGTPLLKDPKRMRIDTSLSAQKLKAKKRDPNYYDLIGKNIYNYFHNYCHATAGSTMWSILSDYKPANKKKRDGQREKSCHVDTRRYDDDYIECTARATNQYSDRKYLAYVRNIFMNPFLSMYYRDHGCTINEEEYAVAELIQWVWRSAIRNGEDIYIYLPSARMRILFQEWIDKVSCGEEVRDRRPYTISMKGNDSDVNQ